MHRRRVLLTALALSASACGRVDQFAAPIRPTNVPARAVPEFEPWNQEARAMLSDALETLRTFDDFQAFRVSTTADSERRLKSELVWDAPRSATWDEATHVARGMHGRAEQLFINITTARVDASVWRQRRELADASNQLIDLADALAAYRERVDTLPVGDASGALGLLDKAWAQWDAAAAQWSVGRAEQVACAA